MTKDINKSSFLIKSLTKNIASGNIEQEVHTFINSTRFNIDEALKIGEILMRKEMFDLASRIYAKIIEIDGKNIVALSNLGGTLVNLQQHSYAESVLRYALELDPNYTPALINIGGSLQGQGKREDVLDVALRAVCSDPSNPICHQSLGAAFSELGHLEEARHSFETALILDPNMVDAEICIATIDQQLGRDLDTALNRYKRAIQLIPKNNNLKKDLVKFYMANLYLRLGDLKNGWNYFESGFSKLLPKDAGRNPNRKFFKPQWKGESLEGKTLLIWREQGVGDLIIFSTVLKDLEKLDGSIIVEVDRRLVTAFQRSFNNFIVREQKYIEGAVSHDEDFDFQIPLLSLMQYYRDTKEKFINKETAYIKTDPVKDILFKDRLSKFSEKKKIGICWRSGKSDPNRNKHYTDLLDWGDILSNPNFVFVNLQYGECENEIISAEKEFGVNIVRWPDVNLKDDFDSVFSIIKNLDAVISISSTPFAMGGAVGKTTIVMTRQDWTTLNFSERYAWFNSVIPIYAQQDEYMANCLAKIPVILESVLQ